MLFKRGNIWWMEVGGKRESTKMKDEDAAKRIYQARKTEHEFGSKPAAAPKKLGDAFKRYLIEHAHKRTIEEDRAKSGWWTQKLGDVPLAQVTAVKIRDAIEAKRAEDGISNATSNRYIAMIRTVLRCCEIDWGWIQTSPKLRMYTEDNQRDTFMTQAQIADLLRVLPPHLTDMVLFSLATGLRQSNVTGLMWEWVNLDKGLLTVPSSSYKSKRQHTIPLNATAVNVLKRQVGKHKTHVFTYRGERVRSVNNTAWRNALTKAGLEEFRWHDLRHTFASHHAMGGTPLQVLQELGGWKSASVMQRYAHLSKDHLRQYGSNSPV